MATDWFNFGKKKGKEYASNPAVAFQLGKKINFARDDLLKKYARDEIGVLEMEEIVNRELFYLEDECWNDLNLRESKERKEMGNSDYDNYMIDGCVMGVIDTVLPEESK